MSVEEQSIGTRKNHFYRDSYRRVIKGLLFFALTAAILLLILLFVVFNEGQPDYYATTTAGEQVPMHSLSEPVITKPYLLRWASLATRLAFNVNWVNYQTNFAKAKLNFTDDGWNKFQDALKQSQLLDTVQNKKLQMSAVVNGPPVIISTAIIRGRYTWRVQLPLLVTFTSASESSQSHWIITMNIQRVPTLDSFKGIQINDFKASPKI